LDRQCWKIKETRLNLGCSAIGEREMSLSTRVNVNMRFVISGLTFYSEETVPPPLQQLAAQVMMSNIGVFRNLHVNSTLRILHIIL